MIYKFKSKAGGDIIMMGPNGDQVMQLLGREPAAKGIFEVAALPAAIQSLEAGVAEDEAARAQAEADAKAKGEKLPPREGVSLRQRVWPLVELMKRAQGAGHDITWGV
jgi:hypothetical protein